MALALHKGGIRLMRVFTTSIKILFIHKFKSDNLWESSLKNSNNVVLKTGSRNKNVFITGFFFVRNLSNIRNKSPPI